MYAGGKYGRRMRLAALVDISNKNNMESAFSTSKPDVTENNGFLRKPLTQTTSSNKSLKRPSQRIAAAHCNVYSSAENNENYDENIPPNFSPKKRKRTTAEVSRKVVPENSVSEAVPPTVLKEELKSNTTVGVDEMRAQMFRYLEEDKTAIQLDQSLTQTDDSAKQSDQFSAVNSIAGSQVPSRTDYGKIAGGEGLVLREFEQLKPFCYEGGYRETERRHLPVPYIFNDRTRRGVANRQLLVNWMMAMVARLKLNDHTLHFAVRLTDDFLAVNGQHTKYLNSQEAPGPKGPTTSAPTSILCKIPASTPATRLQRLGATALWVSAKLHEIGSKRPRFPPAKRFVQMLDIPDFQWKHLLRAEATLLKTLSFSLCAPTAVSFASAYGLVVDNPLILQLVNYLMDLSLHAHCALEFAPSVLSAAAFFSAVEMIPQTSDAWCVEDPKQSMSIILDGLTNYKEEDLQAPCELLQKLATDARLLENIGVGNCNYSVDTKHASIVSWMKENGVTL